MTRTILFVCTGNTCRSPMAAGLARALLDELGVGGWRVLSAGVAASHAGAPNEEAVREMARRGIDISHHRTRPLTRAMIEGADAVYAMTAAHAAMARELAGPEHAGKIEALDPEGEIPDPIGMGPEVYRQTADRLAEIIRSRLKEGRE